MCFTHTHTRFSTQKRIKLSERVTNVALHRRMVINHHERRCKRPKTPNCCWSHSSFTNSMKWVRLSGVPPPTHPPLLFSSPDTEQGAHSSKSRSPRWGRQGGGRREGEENTWRTQHGCRSPSNTFSLALLPSSCWLSLFHLFLTLSPPLLLDRGHHLRVNSLCHDKRLSSD